MTGRRGVINFQRQYLDASVSAVIQAVTPVSTVGAVQPTAGATTQATSGETFVVTDPSTGATTPTTITAPESGDFKVAVGTTQSNVVVKGDGTAGVTIGNATDTAGGELNASGSSFQIADSYRGTVIANLSGAIVDGTKVDVSTDTGNGSIGANLPGGGSNAFATSSDIDYYINTGAANDQVEGSKGNDFIRAGAGDDVVNSGGGDDIVRFGAGSDSGSLGAGDDIVYFTVDQLQGSSTNTITDFDSSGNDKIQIDADLKNLVDITGKGTKSIKITLSGAQTGTTTVVSEGNTIDDDDIEFV